MLKKLLYTILFAIMLVSFSSKKPAYMSILDSRNVEKMLADIPKGVYHMGTSDQDSRMLFCQPSRTVSVDSFYCSKYEVSNGQYCEFLNDIFKADTNQYKKLLPDTLVWRAKFAYNEPYVEYYLKHPAYSNYPVVGVSFEQAESFCAWLTKKYEETGRKYKKAIFKLPTQEQWEYAAHGGLYNPYPWEGRRAQEKNGKWRANFLAIDPLSAGRDSLYEKNIFGKYEKKEFLNCYGFVTGAKDGDITVPVYSYQPNGYGLFNMAGNVEEYVREKGITKGGGWNDPGSYLQIAICETYDSTNYVSAARGFRFVMEIAK